MERIERHEVTIFDDGRQARCRCGAWWSAREGDPSWPTCAEWGVAHERPDMAGIVDATRELRDASRALARFEPVDVVAVNRRIARAGLGL